MTSERSRVLGLKKNYFN